MRCAPLAKFLSAPDNVFDRGAVLLLVIASSALLELAMTLFYSRMTGRAPVRVLLATSGRLQQRALERITQRIQSRH